MSNYIYIDCLGVVYLLSPHHIYVLTWREGESESESERRFNDSFNQI
jgi:hypothetical protein